MIRFLSSKVDEEEKGEQNDEEHDDVEMSSENEKDYDVVIDETAGSDEEDA